MKGSELGDKLVEKYELGKKHGRREQYYFMIEKIEVLKKKIKKESLIGYTREMIIDGVFSRIIMEMEVVDGQR